MGIPTSIIYQTFQLDSQNMTNLSKNYKKIAMSEVYFGQSPASILASWLLVFVVVVFSSRSHFS